MTKPPVTHYFWSDGLFQYPAYCRPFLVPLKATVRREAVTCQACLRKLEKDKEREQR